MARPSDGTHHKGGKKNRKHGRNKKWCEIYHKSGTREKNKKIRMLRTAAKQPNNKALLRQLADL